MMLSREPKGTSRLTVILCQPPLRVLTVEATGAIGSATLEMPRQLPPVPPPQYTEKRRPAARPRMAEVGSLMERTTLGCVVPLRAGQLRRRSRAGLGSETASVP